MMCLQQDRGPKTRQLRQPPTVFIEIDGDMITSPAGDPSEEDLPELKVSRGSGSRVWLRSRPPEAWHMWQRVMIGFPVGLLLPVGCTSMTPEARLVNELYWGAAKACEARYHTLHLDAIDQNGSLSIHSDADSRTEYRPFVACYREEVRTRIEKQRQAGLPVPEALNREPTVELD